MPDHPGRERRVRAYQSQAEYEADARLAAAAGFVVAEHAFDGRTMTVAYERAIRPPKVKDPVLSGCWAWAAIVMTVLGFLSGAMNGLEYALVSGAIWFGIVYGIAWVVRESR